MSTCSFEECSRHIQAKGLCKRHYERLRIHGHASIVKPNAIPKFATLDERFENSIEIVTESGCWIWTGRVDKFGYGNMSELGKRRGKVIRAHRFSYKRFVGEIPDDMCVCHKCDVTSCVNPNHLWLGTNQENTADKVKKGRHFKGSRHHLAKLIESEVKEIRNKLQNGAVGAELAREYLVSAHVISSIKLNHTWKGVS